MPSKAELREEIRALSEGLGADLPDIESMSHSELTRLLSDFKFHRDNAVSDETEDATSTEPPPPPKPAPVPIDGTADDSVGGPPAPAPPPPPPQKHEYQIAPGHAVVCGRGNLGPGKEVFASDFSQDPDEAQATLQRHVDAGRVLHRKG